MKEKEKKKRKSLRGGVKRPRNSYSYLCKAKEGAHHRMRAMEAKRRCVEVGGRQ